MITAQLSNGTVVSFENDGKTTDEYKLFENITNIQMSATGYENGSLSDHTIVMEVIGDENTKNLTLIPKNVSQNHYDGNK